MANRVMFKICVVCSSKTLTGNFNLLLLKRPPASIYLLHAIDAKNISNISACYQERYQSDGYDLVFVLCEKRLENTDDFIEMCSKIDALYGTNASCYAVLTSDDDFLKLENNSGSCHSENFKEFLWRISMEDSEWVGTVSNLFERGSGGGRPMFAKNFLRKKKTA